MTLLHTLGKAALRLASSKRSTYLLEVFFQYIIRGRLDTTFHPLLVVRRVSHADPRRLSPRHAHATR